MIDRRKILFYFKNSVKGKGYKGLIDLYRNYNVLKKRPSRISISPILLGLELTTRCPLNCKMCFRSEMHESRIGDMSFKNYKRILGQFPYVIKVNLSGLGENFLHPDLLKIINYTKKERKIPFVWNSSNGQIMDKYMAKEIVNSGLDWLLISIDSPDSKTYSEIRKGGDFNRLLNNIRLLVKAKNKYKADHFRLTLDTTIQKENIQQLEEILFLANDLGVKDVLFAAVIEEFTSDKETKVDDYMLTEQRKQRLSNLANELGIRLEWGGDFKFCFEPWLRPCITWDGYLIPCYLKPVAEKFNFGNILEKPFKEIWNGSKIQSFRANMNRPDLCQECPRIWKG